MTHHLLPITTVVLMSYVVYASEECSAENSRTIECYECSTFSNDRYCADPFNATHPDVKTIRCGGACAKWVRIPGPGVHHFVRTCSSNINLQMPVALVCMKESRPGDGHLCMCKKSRCNGSTSLNKTSTKLPALILSFMTLLLIQRYFSGYSNVTKWWTDLCTFLLGVVIYLAPQVALNAGLGDVTYWLWRPIG